ncbi:acyltransferase family protein, partial [Pelomonas sp. KK5]|uniref:acyltransferase family protein n=1 Tax=Pelomonas sp. KK5 TaxID=1855730 RepID=UPI001180C012
MAEARSHMPAIDAAKAIGIVLVVLGHSPGMTTQAVTLIYSFHMPLFFFLSGYLQAGSRHNTLGHKARALLVPYAFFFALSLAYWLATRHLGERARKFAGLGVDDAVLGFFTGLSQDLIVNEALWFFPTLFCCAGLYLLLRRRLSAPAVLGVALAVSAGWTWRGGWDAMRLPWGLDIAWVAMIFYAAGDLLRGAEGRLPTLGRVELLGLLPLTLLVWLLAALQMGRVDLARANFGASLALYLLVAGLGIATVMLASRLVPPNPVTRWLSAHTLVIFPLHGLLINFASGALKFLHFGGDWSGAWTPLFFCWAMLACLPLAALLRRRVPWLLGRPPQLARPV